MPLKTTEQKAQREVRKWIESQRFSEFLTLSSNILTFLSRHTTQIKAMHEFYHKTIPLLDLPKSLKCFSEEPNPTWLAEIICATTPTTQNNVGKDDMLIFHASCTAYKC